MNENKNVRVICCRRHDSIRYNKPAFCIGSSATTCFGGGGKIRGLNKVGDSCSTNQGARNPPIYNST